MSRTSRPTTSPIRSINLPPLLSHVIRSAASDRRLTEPGDEGTRHKGVSHAAALQAFARLFMLTLPARGVLALGDDLCQNIDEIAKRHLDRAAADSQFHLAINTITSVQQRDAIETAHALIVDVSELAHYYAGLAAGITLAELGRTER